MAEMIVSCIQKPASWILSITLNFLTHMLVSALDELLPYVKNNGGNMKRHNIEQNEAKNTAKGSPIPKDKV